MACKRSTRSAKHRTATREMVPNKEAAPVDAATVRRSSTVRATDGKPCNCQRGHPGHVHYVARDYSRFDYLSHEQPPPQFGTNAGDELRRALGGA